MIEFRTELSGSEVNITKLEATLPHLKGLREGSNFEIVPGTFTISWAVELELRKWGIKSIIPSVSAVEGSFDINFLDANGDDLRIESYTFDSKEFDLEIDVPVDDYTQMQVTNIWIDYANKNVNID